MHNSCFLRLTNILYFQQFSIFTIPKYSGYVMLKLVRAKTSPAGTILAGQKWSPSAKFGPPPGPLLAGLIGPAGPIIDRKWFRIALVHCICYISLNRLVVKNDPIRIQVHSINIYSNSCSIY